MDVAFKQMLESEGIEVMDTAWDFHYKTRVFLRFPDGRTLAFYEHLHNIPVLNQGDEGTLATSSVPLEVRIDNVNAGLHQIYSADGQLITIVGFILWVILSSLLFYFIFSLIEKWHAPCGTSGRTEEISDCIKLIIKPNCQARTFNSCDEEWVEGDDWSEPAPDLGNIIMWAVIGIIAIGGVYFIVKGFPQKQYYPPPEHHAPGIEYIE